MNKNVDLDSLYVDTLGSLHVQAFGFDGEWTNREEFYTAMKRMSMTPLQMAREFRETFGQELDIVVDPTTDVVTEAEETATRLIEEEYKEVREALTYEGDDHGSEEVLKELADPVYVVYGYAALRGWNLDKALSRVHLSNISKIDPETGTVLKREDGKVLKPKSYRPPYLKDLV